MKQLQIFEKLKQKSAHWGAQIESEHAVSDNVHNDPEMMPSLKRHVSKDDSYLIDKKHLGGAGRHSALGEDCLELQMVEDEIATHIIDF